MQALLKAAPQGTYGWVCNFIGEPRPGADWGGRPYRGGGQLEAEVDTWQPHNTYFSVSALKRGEDGEEARKKRLFLRLLALLVDDANPEELRGRPSWILETSPGKNQIGILLDGDDPDCANQGLCDAVMRVLFERGLIGGDKSGNNSVRYGRLPVGSNLKARAGGPWRHAMRFWNLEQRMSLADALAVVGVDIEDSRSSATAEASAGMQLGPGTSQDDRVAMWGGNIMRGVALHDSINGLAASMVSSGMHAGAVVNVLRGMLMASMAPRDARFQERYDDIPRAVRTAEQFRPPAAALVQALEKEPLLISAGAMVANVKPIQWLIREYLETDAISMLYGPPEVGKSFISIEQACCVAAGRPWHGRATKQGPVVMVIGEGHAGVKRRLAAWGKAKNVDMAKLPLFVTTRAVPFLNVEKAQELVEAIVALRETMGGDPILITIDTLARNFGDGDENSTQDASAFIAVLDVGLRQRWRCHVKIVHHSGHVNGRARGSTVFRGSVDQEFEASPAGGYLVYSARKMKDAEKPRDLQFSIEGGIEVGMDGDEPITGAVLKLVSSELDAEVLSVGGKRITIFDVLKSIEDEWIGNAAIATQFGCHLNSAKKAVKCVYELGKYLEPIEGKGNNLGYTLTAAAKVAMSRTGEYVLKDGQ